jgi:hypothetical protein
VRERSCVVVVGGMINLRDLGVDLIKSNLVEIGSVLDSQMGSMQTVLVYDFESGISHVSSGRWLVWIGNAFSSMYHVCRVSGLVRGFTDSIVSGLLHLLKCNYISFSHLLGKQEGKRARRNIM